MIREKKILEKAVAEVHNDFEEDEQKLRHYYLIWLLLDCDRTGNRCTAMRKQMFYWGHSRRILLH
mgnify:CR=1 FL=1